MNNEMYRNIILVVYIMLVIIVTAVRKFFKPKLSERALKKFNICSGIVCLITIAIVFYVVF